ncbi:hypothetical protein DL96DRAFT_1707413 [Flagelloscypha sp. PMI_526]|nr:hypothetical protein DL96DRAFT_1707413 [Flagelloscypha sp. PMI_526]
MTTPQTSSDIVDQHSGEFQRLRLELLRDFEQSEAFPKLKVRVEGIVSERLNKIYRENAGKGVNRHTVVQNTSDQELLQEVRRYPIVERVVQNSRLQDSDFKESIRETVHRLSRGEGIHPPPSLHRPNGISPRPSSSMTSRNASLDPATPLYRPVLVNHFSDPTGFMSPAQTTTTTVQEGSELSNGSTLVEDASLLEMELDEGPNTIDPETEGVEAHVGPAHSAPETPILVDQLETIPLLDQKERPDVSLSHAPSAPEDTPDIDMSEPSGANATITEVGES